MCYVYLVYNTYSYGVLSIYVFFMLLQYVPTEVYKLLLYLYIQEIHNLLCLFVIITKLCLSHKFRINPLVNFPKTIFCCRQVNLLTSRSVDRPDAENIERRISIRGRLIVVK